MNSDTGRQFISDIAFVYEQQRKLAEGAASQLNDEQFFHALNPGCNSVAVIMKHVGGNLRSRWRDFLTSDGEKPDRNRDGEFIIEGETRRKVMSVWEQGFDTLEQSLGSLTSDDLARTIRIRGEPQLVTQALARNLAHVAHHSGQVVFLAKAISGARWKTLSIPRGGSTTAVLGDFWSGKR